MGIGFLCLLEKEFKTNIKVFSSLLVKEHKIGYQAGKSKTLEQNLGIGNA